VLDAEGKKVGVPIKASSIGCKPTLDNLEKKFTLNETVKESLKPFVKVKVDECLAQSPASIKELMEYLKQKNIYTVLRQNAEGRLYGITFVDNQNKCVFNGSDLGKAYSAAAIQSKLSNPSVEKAVKQDDKEGSYSSGGIGKELFVAKEKEKTNAISATKDNLLDVLLSAKEQFGNTPYSLLKKKRKKKRRNPNS